MKIFELQVNRQTRVHCSIWYPDGEPSGVVQIIHGVSDYAARYDALACHLASHGFLVVGEDHPGHGYTAELENQYGFLTGGWFNAVECVHALYLKIHDKFPHLPYIMFGHSMGSFLLRTYLFRYDTPLAGAIISGTAWQPELLLRFGVLLCREEGRRLGDQNSSKLLIKMIFGAYNQKFAPVRTPYDWVSSDPAVVDAYAIDPRCAFVPSIQLCREMLQGIRSIQQQNNLRQMNKHIPILFLSGQVDPVGDMGKGVYKTAQAFRRCGMKNVSVKLFQNMRHEPHNEIGKEQVFADVLQWIKCMDS